MKAGGYEFKCIEGTFGPQTPQEAFDFIQEKLGAKDAVDYEGFHITRQYSASGDKSSYVQIVATQQNSNSRQGRPVSFFLGRFAGRTDKVEYVFASLDDLIVAINGGERLAIDLHNGACEEGALAFGSIDDKRFRQMTRAELSAYTYLFGASVQTLEYDPAIDYEELAAHAANLLSQFSKPAGHRLVDLGEPAIFSIPRSPFEAKIYALRDVLSALRILERSTAVSAEARKEARLSRSSLNFQTVYGASPEEAWRMAEEHAETEERVRAALRQNPGVVSGPL